MEPSIYEQLITQLSAASISSPRLEARILISAATNIPADSISNSTLLNPEELQKLQKMLSLRIQHKPLDKIVGYKDFFKSTFCVNDSVLSPRPDTEVLVESALDIIKKHNIQNILDMGTGSGCILLSLLAESPQCNGIGIDKSAQALKIAQTNCQQLHLSNTCQFYQADWFDEAFITLIPHPFDLIVSNPPYIPSSDITSLETEVKDFDPMDALDGGIDGLESYKKIAQLSQKLLKNNGFILLEVGIGQAPFVVNIFTNQGLEHIETLHDLSHIERCIIFRKKDCN